MPLVGGSAQPAGANGHAIVLRVRRTRQMIDGKAQCALRCRITLDPKVRYLPSCQPGISVLTDHACHVLDRALSVRARGLARIGSVPRGMQSDNPVEPICFAYLKFEALPALNQFD